MKKRVLVTSLLTIALCISIICGATLAIFATTDTTKIDINSANVETATTAAFVGYKTMDREDWVTENVDANSITFDDGITATIDDKSGDISMDKLRAGDKVRIQLTATNSSNISIKYHMLLTAGSEDVWTDLSLVVKSGDTVAPLWVNPENRLERSTGWQDATAVAEGQTADLYTYTIELGFDDDAVLEEMSSEYTLTLNTVAQQANAPTTEFVDIREDDLINNQGYKPADSNSSLTELANGSNEKIVVTEDLAVDQNTPKITGSTTIDFNYNKIIRETRDGSGLKVTNYDADVTLQNGEFVSVKGGVIARIEGAKSLTIKDSKFINLAQGSTGSKLFQLTPSEADKKITIVFENCVFDTGYVGIEGYNNVTEYDIQFINCTFLWDDVNGSSFVQAGSYAKGTYYFKDCSFEYTNWLSGDLIEINNPTENAKSEVILEGITVRGSGEKKPYVASGFSVVGKQNLTVTYTGENQYFYDGTLVDWESIYLNK